MTGVKEILGSSRRSALLVVLLGAIFSLDAAGQSGRDWFAVELPGISAERYTRPIVRVRENDVPVIRIRVFKPLADHLHYKLIITLNGDGIRRGCSPTSDNEGAVFTCGRQQDRLGGYNLIPGKNVLELTATDPATEKELYASYVIMTGDRTAPAARAGHDAEVERFAGRKFAVIVGVSDYLYQDAGVRSLDHADDDARSMAAFLQTPAGGSFLASDIKLLVDRDASLLALRSALAETARVATRNDLILIFLAGHGAPDPLAAQNLYFLFHDTKVVDMEKTAYPMIELKQFLETKVAADRVFVLIDTCHSAGVNNKSRTLVSGRQLEREGDENNLSNFFASKQLFRERGRAVITSSDVNESSQESAKWGNHGVFTWSLLDGLKGKADTNGDKMITAAEIFEFTRSNVQRETNFEQNPIALPGSSANLVLAYVKGRN
jgi:uncharacterized caspase-like protein